MMLARNSLVTSQPGPPQGQTARRLLLSSVVICVASALAVFTALFLREGASARRLTPVQTTLLSGPVASSKPSTTPVLVKPAAPAPNNKPDANVPENAVPPPVPTQPEPAENPADLVARTHAELKMLEDTTDRRFTEFSLTRSNRLRLGSIKLQLRKVNSRNRSAQVSIWTGNASLGEKRAGLYVPVEIPSNKSSGSAFLILTQISAGSVSGYLTEPRAPQIRRKGRPVTNRLTGRARTKNPERAPG